MFESGKSLKTAAAAALMLVAAPASAEDGYRLWLRYNPIEAPQRARYANAATELVVDARGSTSDAAASELRRGLSGLLATTIISHPHVDRDGAIVLALRSSIARDLRPEGFVIRTTRVRGHRVTLITANSERGLLYGAFALLRRIQTRQSLSGLDVRDGPALPIRMLDHWDNPDGFVERGYAGRSLWDWPSLPARIDRRYVDYARANASVGINGTVLNNVNAKAEMLTPAYLSKVKALADTFRPWGIRVYLSARFSAPIELGHLKTADPLDPAVRAWWRAKRFVTVSTPWER